MGIFTKCNPLLNKLAAKPPTSPVIPPPIANKLSSLEKFLLSKISKIEFIVVWFLFFSLALKLNKNIFLFCSFFLISEINFLGTFLSTTNKHFFDLMELSTIKLDIFVIRFFPINIGYFSELVLIINLIGFI